jgi:hypothetical protein
MENEESMNDVQSRIADALLMTRQEYNMYVDGVMLSMSFACVYLVIICEKSVNITPKWRFTYQLVHINVF